MRLWVATVNRNHLDMALMDSSTQKKKKRMKFHMCVCPKNLLEAVFDTLAASNLKNVALWFLNLNKIFGT